MKTRKNEISTNLETLTNTQNLIIQWLIDNVLPLLPSAEGGEVLKKFRIIGF